ncbi:MAG: DNA cytosine methyltransferase [bacterium]
MKKVESKNEGWINGKVSANDIEFALPPGPRESYHFSSSGKHVSRVVEFPGGPKTVSKLSNDCHRTSYDDPGSDFDWLYLRLKHRSPGENSTEPIRCVDLFSGCGGLSLGAKEACMAADLDFQPILALDNDAAALAVYVRNFSPIRAHNCDIEHIVNGKNGGRITAAERELLNEIKTVDLLLAGPPCQGHSDLNNHTRRKDKRNTLYERVGRFAEIMEPESILIENVPTIIHSHDRVLFETIELLQRRGYQVDSGIVDLSEVGVPQKRKRHVLVASLDNYVKIEEVVEKYRVSLRTVRWAIEDLEQEKSNGIFAAPSCHTTENLKRIDYLFENELYDLPDAMRPACHRNGHSYKSMYGRIHYDEPAQTITSGYGCPGQGRFIHPTQRRALTPHEAARLQFFPDFFDFSNVERRTALANMIGNAVPMKLSYVFTLELLG